MQQRLRGCEGDAQFPAKIFGEEQKACPRRLIKEDPIGFGRLCQLYSLYDKGVLMVEGGWLDQPNYYVEAMTVFSSALAEVQEEKMREAEGKRGKPRSPRPVNPKSRK
jgi:hypothetical protein